MYYDHHYYCYYRGIMCKVTWGFSKHSKSTKTFFFLNAALFNVFPRIIFFKTLCLIHVWTGSNTSGKVFKSNIWSRMKCIKRKNKYLRYQKKIPWNRPKTTWLHLRRTNQACLPGSAAAANETEETTAPQNDCSCNSLMLLCAFLALHLQELWLILHVKLLQMLN